jgi:hypothetical protein
VEAAHIKEPKNRIDHHFSYLQSVGIPQPLAQLILLKTFRGLITSILRFVNFFEVAVFVDVTWYSVPTEIWTIVETGCYLIAACLPSFRPLFGPLFNKIDFGSLGHTVLRYGSKMRSKRGKTEQSGSSTGINGSQETNRGFEMLGDPSTPRLSDGNDQKGLVSCYREASSQEIDNARSLHGDGACASQGICVKKEYGIQGV